MTLSPILSWLNLSRKFHLTRCRMPSRLVTDLQQIPDGKRGISHHDLLRFQSILANSSSDKRPGSDQRDCGSLGSAVQLEMRGLVSSSSDLRTGHWSVHTDKCRTIIAA